MSGNRISFFRRNRLRVRKEASQKEQTSQVRFTLSRVEHETLTDEVTVETKFPRRSFKSRSYDLVLYGRGSRLIDFASVI